MTKDLKKICFRNNDAASNTAGNTVYIAWPQEYLARSDDTRQVDECLKLSLFLNLKSITFEASH